MQAMPGSVIACDGSIEHALAGGRRLRIVAVMAAALLLGMVLTCPAATASCGAAGNTCDLRERIAAANAYLAERPGTVGYVLRDRVTGTKYRNPNAGLLVWTASTIKLAMVADLLSRERLGAVRLSAEDRRLMVAMLRDSDNSAADTLWSRYGGPDHRAFNANFSRYGLSDLRPQQGFSSIFPYWGTQKSTTDDLDRLMNYVLSGLNPADAAAVAAEMRRVSSAQRWGVWGAGSAMAPGNKNGWSLEPGGWVVNSVGFAGSGQRYTLAIMNALGGQGGFEEGRATTTRLSEILLGPAG